MNPDRYQPPDPTRVDATKPEALQWWAGLLGTDDEKLREAVRKVGPELEAVKEELGIGGAG